MTWWEPSSRRRRQRYFTLDPAVLDEIDELKKILHLSGTGVVERAVMLLAMFHDHNVVVTDPEGNVVLVVEQP